MDSIDALAELVVGDCVRINQYARPRYLRGLRATIIELTSVTATVSLDRPIGRFTIGRLRCPPPLRSTTRCVDGVQTIRYLLRLSWRFFSSRRVAVCRLELLAAVT